MDNWMPKKNGIQSAKEIKELNKILNKNDKDIIDLKKLLK